MNDDSQEEKQNFLRTNILEQGYDVNQFVAFLQSKKGEAGADISNWSMEDLYAVVKEFIFKINAEQQNQNLSQPQQSSVPSVPTIAQNSDIRQSSASINLTEEDFGIVIPEYTECLKTEITELYKYDNIEITVKEPQKVNAGFFSKTYINFLITTNPINANVRRKHADFVWLRERLSIIFNLSVLPRLVKKIKDDDNKMNKKMRDLEAFLVYLAKDPLIKTSQIFYDFLTLENDSDFEKRKKIYNKLKTPIELKDIKTIDGRMKISVNPNKEQFLDNIRDNSAFNETALKKFNQNFKLLKQEMNVVISRVLSFGPLFDKLIKISTTYLDNSVILESYNQMKNIFNTWADVLKKQNSFFFNDVKEYLKLLSGNYHHLRDLVQFVETIKLNYTKVSKNLMNKKSELFRKQDISGWQLDENDKKNIGDFYSDRLASYKKICFKETNNVIKIKEKYGYHLNKMINEYQRLRNINTIENKEKIIQFSKKQSQISSDYFKIMGEIIGIMEDCAEKYKKEKEMGLRDQQSMDFNEQINIIEKKEEYEENQNKINTEIYEPKKEEIIEDKREEFKNEIKEEKIEEKIKEDKIQEEENNKKEENNEEKLLEKKEEEKKEEERKDDENVKEEKKEEKNNEDKKEEIKDDNKNEIIEEKNDEKNEERKEDAPEENKEEEK